MYGWSLQSRCSIFQSNAMQRGDFKQIRCRTILDCKEGRVERPGYSCLGDDLCFSICNVSGCTNKFHEHCQHPYIRVGGAIAVSQILACIVQMKSCLASWLARPLVRCTSGTDTRSFSLHMCHFWLPSPMKVAH